MRKAEEEGIHRRDAENAEGKKGRGAEDEKSRKQKRRISDLGLRIADCGGRREEGEKSRRQKTEDRRQKGRREEVKRLRKARRAR
jgi:hypothetical protein